MSESDDSSSSSEEVQYLEGTDDEENDQPINVFMDRPVISRAKAKEGAHNDEDDEEAEEEEEGLENELKRWKEDYESDEAESEKELRAYQERSHSEEDESQTPDAGENETDVEDEEEKVEAEESDGGVSEETSEHSEASSSIGGEEDEELEAEDDDEEETKEEMEGAEKGEELEPMKLVSPDTTTHETANQFRPIPPIVLQKVPSVILIQEGGRRQVIPIEGAPVPAEEPLLLLEPSQHPQLQQQNNRGRPRYFDTLKREDILRRRREAEASRVPILLRVTTPQESGGTTVDIVLPRNCLMDEVKMSIWKQIPALWNLPKEDYDLCLSSNNEVLDVLFLKLLNIPVVRDYHREHDSVALTLCPKRPVILHSKKEKEEEQKEEENENEPWKKEAQGLAKMLSKTQTSLFNLQNELIRYLDNIKEKVQLCQVKLETIEENKKENENKEENEREEGKMKLKKKVLERVHKDIQQIVDSVGSYQSLVPHTQQKQEADLQPQQNRVESQEEEDKMENENKEKEEDEAITLSKNEANDSAEKVNNETEKERNGENQSTKEKHGTNALEARSDNNIKAEQSKEANEDEEEKHQQKQKKILSSLERTRLEFLETEETYVNGLGILVDVYLRGLREAEVISLKDTEVIFGNITTIHQIHQNLFSDLKQCVKEKQGGEKDGSYHHRSFGDVLGSFVPFLKMYNVYVNGFNEANKRIKELKISFEEVHLKEENGEDGGEEVLDEDEVEKLKTVLETVVSVNQYVNESKRSQELRQRLYRLQRCVKSHFDIFSRVNRHLVKEGFLSILEVSSYSSSPVVLPLSTSASAVSSSSTETAPSSLPSSSSSSSLSSSTSASSSVPSATLYREHYFFLFDDNLLEVSGGGKSNKFKFIRLFELSKVSIQRSRKAKEDRENDDERDEKKKDEDEEEQFELWNKVTQRKYLLRAKNKSERDHWYEAMKKLIAASKKSSSRPVISHHVDMSSGHQRQLHQRESKRASLQVPKFTKKKKKASSTSSSSTSSGRTRAFTSSSIPHYEEREKESGSMKRRKDDKERGGKTISVGRSQAKERTTTTEKEAKKGGSTSSQKSKRT
ncbi:epithelial cell transforming sequence 2 oncoprotein-like [Balamuthia mandrillaris]